MHKTIPTILLALLALLAVLYNTKDNTSLKELIDQNLRGVVEEEQQ